MAEILVSLIGLTLVLYLAVCGLIIANAYSIGDEFIISGTHGKRLNMFARIANGLSKIKEM